jgi:outer membrane protein assembly factor BamB
MPNPRRKPVCVSLALGLVLAFTAPAFAVVPVLVGPLQAFLALLPSIAAGFAVFLVGLFSPKTLKKVALFFWHQKLFSVGLILFIAGFVYASSNNWWIRGDVTEMQAGRSWPAFRGGARRSGVVPGSPEPTSGDVVWEYTGEKTFYSSPTVVGNRLFVTWADQGPFSDKGGILCIDANTGNEVWRFRQAGFRATFSSPAVHVKEGTDGEGYVVSGEGLHFTENARVFCVDLKTGKLVWVHTTTSHVESSPCIYEYNGTHRVYIGAGSDGYYCIDLEPGTGRQAKVVWQLPGQKYQDCETSPVAGDGVVYLGLGIGGNAIIAVDAEVGNEIWRLDTPYPVFTPPTLVDGKLYVGMGNGDFVFTAEGLQAKVEAEMKKAGRSAEEIAAAKAELQPAGEVWCIDVSQARENPKAVKPEWVFKAGRTVLGAIAAVGDRLYFGSRDRHIYCISNRGELIAKWRAPGAIITSPAVGDRYAYVVSEVPVTGSGMLYCLTAEDLKPVWEVRLGAGPNFFSSPCVALGHVYVGTPNDGLRCVGRVGEPPPLVWPHGERGGRIDRAPIPEKGRMDWRFPKTSEAKIEVTGPLVGARDVAVGTRERDGKTEKITEDGVIIPCLREGKPHLIKLKIGEALEREVQKLKDDEKLQDEQRIAWATPLPGPVRSAPAAMGDALYVVTDPVAERDGRRLLLQINAANGAKAGEIALPGDVPAYVTLDEQRLYVFSAPDALACYPLDLAGAPAQESDVQPVWTAPLDSAACATPLATEGVVYVTTEKSLVALDALSGVALWPAPVPLDAKPVAAPVRCGALLLFTSEKGVTARSVADGSVVWEKPVGPVRVPPATDGLNVAVVNAAGILHLLNAADGEPLRQPIPGGDGAVPPVLAARRLLLNSANLTVFTSLSYPPREWARTGWLGKVVTPLVLADSHAYFATDKYGVICVRPRQ